MWLPGGISFHEVTERFDREAEALGQLPAEQGEEHGRWQDEFTDQFEKELDHVRETEPDESKWRTAGRATKDKPHGENILWWHTAGRDMVQRYVDWRFSTADSLVMATVKGAPGIEVEVKAPLAGVPVIGYVDRLMRDATTGAPIVVDLKTGSRKPDSPMQLALYSVQLERMLGEPVTWGAYYDARKGVLGEPIPLERFTEDNLGLIYDGLDRAISQNIFIPNVSSGCNSCGVRTSCIFAGGTEPAVTETT